MKTTSLFSGSSRAFQLPGLLVLFLLLAGSVTAQKGISGHCYDKNGQPLAGVEIRTIQWNEAHDLVSDAKGAYADKALTAGEWTVIFKYADEKIVRKVTMAKDDSKVDLDVRFTKVTAP